MRSIMSKTWTSMPLLGYTIMYVLLHCGHATSTVLFPCCFSSTHLCKQDLCTHLAVPLHLHGETH
ncbi:hypothetical protein BpHYR1_048732 [Brachionus plicatilis]|uniref:Uncharacterized protein n=1 Tax=Brachionus plicatilis TaxID=10195 RepID=A0A3M7Q7X2_BRAPC|nr:hypothetical protein BpHYR1_048732 [Brachionus plicatilis]